MQEKTKKTLSLKWGVFLTVILCWVIPIAIIVTVAGVLLSHNYKQDLSQTVEAETKHAMQQMELRLESALESCKAVSYDGEVRESYDQYLRDGDRVQLYRDVTDYLKRSYSHNSDFLAVFISFRDHPEKDYSYIQAKGVTSYSITEDYRSQIGREAMVLAGKMNTGIAFMEENGQVYLVRNLLDKQFRPYAVLTMMCDSEVISRPLRGIPSLISAQVTLDDLTIDLTPQLCTSEPVQKKGPEIPVTYTVDADGHLITFTGSAAREALWGAVPGLQWTILLLLVLLLPLLGLVVYLFYIHINRPVERLVSATAKVRDGERGYQIEERASNQEFQKLTDNFNTMSAELKNQFEQIYSEQQALQESRIQALQFQINPHFLGNTLEIINWEARMAGNEKVAAMIEALATMLDGAIGRDGRSRISLREELTYVDAYLYIIRERIGESLHISKDIDESLLECIIPRLMLQPVVENAIEHDLSKTRGGELVIRAHRVGERMHIEVEHEGHITEEDRKRIDRILSEETEETAEKKTRGHVGLKNLYQRIRLIYGDEAAFSVEEKSPGRVISWIDIPV